MLHLLHRQRVVHLLRTEGPLARADLADRLGLSRPSITAIVGELIDDGTLVELDSRVEGPGYRGRPRKLLGCNPRARRVLGIWIDERRARVVVADATGTITSESETPTAGRSSASVIRSIIGIARQLIDDAAVGPIAAAGVCLPGFIDTATGSVVDSKVLGWSDVDLGGSISDALGIPTTVQDSTQAMTLAETIAGEAREVRSALVLDCGGHVNIGLIIGGRPYSGATGVAGAIGHISVPGSAVKCSCGRVGCVDANMSLHAMQAVAPHTENVPLKDIDLNAVAQDTSRNPHSQKIISDVIDQIARTAILLEAVLDPEILILTGLIVEFGPLIDALEARIDEIRPPERRGRTTTVRSQIGRDYRVAVIVALQQLDPDIAGLLQTSTS
ncbi:ROK family transcriptional regulator [Mycolicibacterium wolinskyi]|uniref:Transcriptional repressor n=1 Tax=Mycolicibacterium wolinskyi TaxID=59750 RepID=A0A1X2ET10_9MYCO|nr:MULTISPECIES: ROK family transcriptional regulator [Mycolicibacterium]MCV7287336.1 ROK family transcriptional regulator [Mycolicibacterium wolinskyi]MCV7295025.1 ROK family transcriptional regulator [Mycolicibacterium goodii]ORX09158.1 transcriptional repressor [Mycolicibacterium wolinskyi]